jgi:hypothetical protein
MSDEGSFLVLENIIGLEAAGGINYRRRISIPIPIPIK